VHGAPMLARESDIAAGRSVPIVDIAAGRALAAGIVAYSP
jgi:hypothetical protein